ncbi:helicase associated domain-containing protein [Streptomyces sp. B21-106]|uniref:helicase associated domain-containing protein n=1 Tax=Streptomyces sp. B21-106 TaxID=3039418 RepID=UPI002FEF009A
MSNLRRPGALDDHPEWKTALEEVAEDWNPAWPAGRQRHYAALRELVREEAGQTEVLPGVTVHGMDVGRWLHKQRRPTVWQAPKDGQRERLETLGIEPLPEQKAAARARTGGPSAFERGTVALALAPYRARTGSGTWRLVRPGGRCPPRMPGSGMPPGFRTWWCTGSRVGRPRWKSGWCPGGTLRRAVGLRRPRSPAPTIWACGCWATRRGCCADTPSAGTTQAQRWRSSTRRAHASRWTSSRTAGADGRRSGRGKAAAPTSPRPGSGTTSAGWTAARSGSGRCSRPRYTASLSRRPSRRPR